MERNTRRARSRGGRRTSTALSLLRRFAARHDGGRRFERGAVDVGRPGHPHGETLLARGARDARGRVLSLCVAPPPAPYGPLQYPSAGAGRMVLAVVPR